MLDEDYELEEFLEIQALVRVGLDLLGLSWSHPRLVAYFQAVEERVNYPVRSRHDLPFAAYRALALKLVQAAQVSGFQLSTERLERRES